MAERARGPGRELLPDPARRPVPPLRAARPRLRPQGLPAVGPAAGDRPAVVGAEPVQEGAGEVRVPVRGRPPQGCALPEGGPRAGLQVRLRPAAQLVLAAGLRAARLQRPDGPHCRGRAGGAAGERALPQGLRVGRRQRRQAPADLRAAPVLHAEVPWRRGAALENAVPGEAEGQVLAADCCAAAGHDPHVRGLRAGQARVLQAPAHQAGDRRRRHPGLPVPVHLAAAVVRLVRQRLPQPRDGAADHPVDHEGRGDLRGQPGAERHLPAVGRVHELRRVEGNRRAGDLRPADARAAEGEPELPVLPLVALQPVLPEPGGGQGRDRRPPHVPDQPRPDPRAARREVHPEGDRERVPDLRHIAGQEGQQPRVLRVPFQGQAPVPGQQLLLGLHQLRRAVREVQAGLRRLPEPPPEGEQPAGGLQERRERVHVRGPHVDDELLQPRPEGVAGHAAAGGGRNAARSPAEGQGVRRPAGQLRGAVHHADQGLLRLQQLQLRGGEVLGRLHESADQGPVGHLGRPLQAAAAVVQQLQQRRHLRRVQTEELRAHAQEGPAGGHAAAAAGRPGVGPPDGQRRRQPGQGAGAVHPREQRQPEEHAEPLPEPVQAGAVQLPGEDRGDHRALQRDHQPEAAGQAVQLLLLRPVILLQHHLLHARQRLPDPRGPGAGLPTAGDQGGLEPDVPAERRPPLRPVHRRRDKDRGPGADQAGVLQDAGLLLAERVRDEAGADPRARLPDAQAGQARGGVQHDLPLQGLPDQ